VIKGKIEMEIMAACNAVGESAKRLASALDSSYVVVGSRAMSPEKRVREAVKRIRASNGAVEKLLSSCEVLSESAQRTEERTERFIELNSLTVGG